MALKNLGKKALFVGINKYQDSKLSDLKFSVNDVSSLYDILTDVSRGAFSADNCLLMTDKSKNSNLKPIRSNLISSIQSLSEAAKPNDYVLFFFSGHGIEEDEKSYLLPSDARINVLRESAVSIDWIKKTLKKSKARAKVLILDACHAGAMKGKAESGRMTKGLHDALFPALEGFATLSSCKLNEVSYEMPETKHGVFSYFLIEGLKGAADFDSDGHIMVSDASRYTAEKTVDWSFKEGVKQTPNLEYNVVGDLFLVDVPKPEKREAQTKVEEVARDFNVPILHITSVFPSERKEDMENTERQYFPKFCTYLLRHFSLDEIKYKPQRGPKQYIFPMGEFNHYALQLKYNPQHLKMIDEILIASANILPPNYVFYISSMPFDFKRITVMLQRMKWTPIHYDPRLFYEPSDMIQRPFLQVSPSFSGLKQTLLLDFTIQSIGKEKSQEEKQRSYIRIRAVSKAEESLDSISMQLLKPTRFLDIIGDIWEHK